MDIQFIGWKCPECGKILSPYMTICPFCNGTETKKMPEIEQNTKDSSIDMTKLFESPDILDEYFNGPKEGGA